MDSTTVRNIVTILVSVSFSAAGQTCLKLGLNRLGSDPNRSGLGVLVGAAMQPLCWLGLVLFGFSVLIWMMVLARAELSWAYPMLGLSYVLVTMSGIFIFGEQASFGRLLGTAFVLVGAALIGRS